MTKCPKCKIDSCYTAYTQTAINHCVMCDCYWADEQAEIARLRDLLAQYTEIHEGKPPRDGYYFVRDCFRGHLWNNWDIDRIILNEHNDTYWLNRQWIGPFEEPREENPDD